MKNIGIILFIFLLLFGAGCTKTQIETQTGTISGETPDMTESSSDGGGNQADEFGNDTFR